MGYQMVEKVLREV